jgi:Rod binding domain-containing protein
MSASALNPLRADATSNPTLVGYHSVDSSSGLNANRSIQQDQKLEEVSRQFEAVLLRQMLSSLGRAAGGTSGQSGGSTIYGSMIVDAVAEAVSRAGGIGLGSMLAKALQSPNPEGRLDIDSEKRPANLVPLSLNQSPPGNSAQAPNSSLNQAEGRPQ